MKLFVFITVCLLFGFFKGASQKALQIRYSRLGQVKRYKLFIGDRVDYKLKGEHFIYHKNTIADVHDSIILFANDDEVKLDALKSLKFRTGNHFMGTVERFFMIGGVGLFSISAFNNALYGRRPVFSESISYISASFVAASLLFREIAIKRIRINRHKEVKILDFDYEHLNTP